MTPFERLNKVLEYANIDKLAQFASFIEIAPQSLYDIKAGKCEISGRVAKAITKKFPKFSLDWLMDDDGEMFIDNLVESKGDYNANGKESKVVVGGGEAIKMLVAEMAEQRKATSDIMQRQADQIDQLISLLAKK